MLRPGPTTFYPEPRNVLMTVASFGAAGYAILLEDDPKNSPHSENRMHR